MCDRALPNDVVLLRPLKLEQPEFRPRPVDAVLALGIASYLSFAARAFAIGQCTVVHPVKIAILKHGYVSRTFRFPRAVECQRHFPRLRPVYGQPSVLKTLDQMPVHEQFAP